jgi:hypothetical protein
MESVRTCFAVLMTNLTYEVCLSASFPPVVLVRGAFVVPSLPPSQRTQHLATECFKCNFAVRRGEHVRPCLFARYVA